jgi:hypothetical protein
MSAICFFNSDAFSIRGRATGQPGWYDIDATLNGIVFSALGQAQGEEFGGQLNKALFNENGKRISEIPGAKFADLIEDVEARYAGSASVTGYCTFYVFHRVDRTLVVILADSVGTVKAHAVIKSEAVKNWSGSSNV